MARLEDVCKKATSNIAQKDLAEHNGDYPIYGASGFIKNVDFYQQESPYIAVVKDGAGIGRVMKLPAKSSVIGTMQYIIPNDAVDISYLAYAMEHMNLSKYFTGATIPHIYFKNYQKEELPLPPLDEQRKIAAVMDKVSDLIAKRRQQLDKLDEMVKARFVEMFGDFKINTMRWPVVDFTEIAIIDGNMTTDYKKYANYPHIGIDSIEKETGRLTGYRTVAEDGVISGKYVFTSRHIIYSKIRPNLNKVALPEFDGLCSADAYPILPIAERCNRTFLAYNMRSQFFLDYILQFCNRTNLPKVNRKEVSSFKTPLPPIELQNHFASFVEQTDKTKNVINRSLKSLEILKEALMQEYFEKEGKTYECYLFNRKWI